MVGLVVFPAPLLLVPLAAGPPALVWTMLALAELGSGLGVMLLDISCGAIFSAVIPDELRARVCGAYRTVNYGVRPLGALAGGLVRRLARAARRRSCWRRSAASPPCCGRCLAGAAGPRRRRTRAGRADA